MAAAHIPKAIWKRLPTLSARSSHYVSITSKGQLLVHGGELLPRTPVDNSLDVPAGSVHAFNLGVKTLKKEAEWVTLKPVGEQGIPEARVGAATTWNDTTERLYLWGGRGGTSMVPFSNDQCGIWEGRIDTANIIWSRVKAQNEEDAPESRSYHAMVSFKEKVYIHAGCPASGRLETLHSFDVRTRRWERLADAPLPGRGGTAVAVVSKSGEDSLLRFGGFAGHELPVSPSHDLDIYNIASNKWTTLTPAPDPAHGHPGPRSVHGFVPFSSAAPGLRDAVAVLFHGEREASSLGHAGAGAFWDDVWVLSRSSAHADTNKESGGFWWRKAEVQGSELPQGHGWFPGVSFVPEGEEGSKAVMVGGLLEDNSRSGEGWVLDVV
ncbi:hypothetical protein BDQ17DRAFT_1435201 [Cyathus striatus]|nr:hypothetical protein BDQ17DRAFT_1435201 [Cyathus striatus]